MIVSKKRIAKFQSLIFSWWKDHKRDLPWRKTHDPYKILVSEIMLQQTQVQRVLAKYVEFLHAFPTVGDLAGSSPAYVLRLWRGMGYNRRALYLHKSAKIIVNTYKSQFPTSEQQLSQLPGLGIYTARVLLVFAYKKDIAAVDTNIRQIITHFFFHDKPQKPSAIQFVADQLVPRGKSWEWHQALMDYGTHLRQTRDVFKKPKRRRMPGFPFRESNRFYRGRIIDMLREKSMAMNILVKEVSARYNKSTEDIVKIIRKLKTDGLVEVEHGVLYLPRQ